MKTRLLLSGILWSALAPASPAEAASQLNFPRLSFGSAEYTGIAIVNPNSTEASVQLTAYGADGSVLQGSNFNNPVPISIPGEQQFSRVTAEIFGFGLDPSLVGWVEASSGADNLTGFFLFLNPAMTFFDGADIPQSAPVVVFNDVRFEGQFSTELNLINPGDLTAEVTLRLMGAAGAPARQLTLPPKGVARVDAAQFFGVASPTGGNALTSAYVTADAGGVPIAGFAFIRGPGDLLGLNALPLTEALNTLYFPQLAVLGGFETQLTVVNYSTSEDAIVTITAFRPDGSPYNAPNVTANPATRLLRAGESLREDLAEMFGFSSNQPGSLEGWVRVQSTAEVVNGSINYSLPQANNAPTAAVASLSSGVSQAVFSHIATTLGFFTGVAILNASSRCANVRVVALTPEGTPLGSFSTTLLPRQRISRLITQLIPESANQGAGVIFVRSSEEVYLTALFGSEGSGVLANIPPQRIPSSFRPDQGLPMPRIRPGTATASPPPGALSTVAFSLDGASAPAQWSVNGIAGGNETFGTIAATSGQNATYSAPQFAPLSQPVNVTAQAGDVAACRSVDITALETLRRGLGEIQSVAHLSGLNRLYVAQLTATGSALRRPADRPLGGVGSVILDVSGASPQTALSIPGDQVSKMIPLTFDEREYLLIAGESSGTVTRFDPDSSATAVVASGLSSPTTMVLDGNGNLLVGDGNGIQTIAAANLRVAAETVPPWTKQQSASGSASFLRFAGTTRGLAIDRCTGNIYSSDVDPQDGAMRGVVSERNPATNETRELARLQEPGQLLGFYRSGLPCPSSFNLLALDPGAEQAVLIVPSEQLSAPWVAVDGGVDVAFLPDSGSFLQAGATTQVSEGVLFARSPAGASNALRWGPADVPQGPEEGRVSIVPVPALYQLRPENPPPAEQISPTEERLFFDDVEGVFMFGTDDANQVWAFTNDVFFSPTRSYVAGDVGFVSDQLLIQIDPVLIPADAVSARLTFQHRFDLEAPFDGGVLEISTDGGETWTDVGELFAVNGYNALIDGTFGNPLGGRQGFTGSTGGVFVQSVVDLTSLRGEQILTRFRLGTDSSVGIDGWYVDDIEITAVFTQQ